MSGAIGLAEVNKMPNLQYLQMPNAGYEDALAYRREGLTICNAQGVHDISTAELTIALITASLRGIDDFARAQAQGQWLQERRPSLAFKRVGLIGYGSVGQTIAKFLEPFRVDLVPFSKSGRDGSKTMDELDGLLPTFDVVILIVPAMAETTNLIDSKRLALMKDGALLVNMARGVVVNPDALLAELNTGRIKAAIDVMVQEPLPADHPLWRAPGVLISPHVGGYSSAFEPSMKALLARQFDQLVLGADPHNIVAKGTEEIKR
jgi:phosphoglycerate dehydrogenase-like enzyme